MFCRCGVADGHPAPERTAAQIHTFILGTFRGFTSYVLENTTIEPSLNTGILRGRTATCVADARAGCAQGPAPLPLWPCTTVYRMHPGPVWLPRAFFRLRPVLPRGIRTSRNRSERRESGPPGAVAVPLIHRNRMQTGRVQRPVPPVSTPGDPMSQMGTPRSQSAAATTRRPWISPRVDELPRLTDLTLQSTGIPGDCDPLDPSSCFP